MNLLVYLQRLTGVSGLRKYAIMLPSSDYSVFHLKVVVTAESTLF